MQALATHSTYVAAGGQRTRRPTIPHQISHWHSHHTHSLTHCAATLPSTKPTHSPAVPPLYSLLAAVLTILIAAALTSRLPCLCSCAQRTPHSPMQCSGMSSPAAASDAASLSSHRALLSSILSYLASLKQSPHASSLLLSTDSLDAALDCLVEATGLPRPSAVSAAPPALPDIFQAGQAALALPSAAASAPSDSDSAAHFSQFVSLLTDRRFFAGLQPGSAAYSDRLAAARQKFDDKYGSGTSSQQWPPQTDSVSETDMRRAEQLKAEGNTYLSSQQYDAAVARYTSALELNPHSAIYYGNRAAAYINLSQWSDAERDCRDAIRIEPHYGKGQPQHHAATTKHSHHLTPGRCRVTPHTRTVCCTD